MRPQSILWIGSANGMQANAVSRAAEIDLVWAREPSDALDLPLASFACVVMDAEAGGQGVADALRRAGAAEVLVTSDPRALPAPRGSGARAPRALRLRAGVVGASEPMQRALALVSRAQTTHATVLLTGETGVGKEVLARAIHSGSPRARGAFVALNCAAFPEALLESELFGHARGAFTGADRAKEGLFVAAHGGTLFLDEVGETSLPFQVKLLRALQEREVRPVGGNRTQRVDVRVIAATNRELRREVDRAAFRADLYYRLAVFPIRVPPLRERREDVEPLARHFLALHGEREAKRGCRLAADALDLLAAHAWPGNVRELENEMLRALALSEPGDEIPAARLSPRLGDVLEPARELSAEGEPLRVTLARFEELAVTAQPRPPRRPTRGNGARARPHPRRPAQEAEAARRGLEPISQIRTEPGARIRPTGEVARAKAVPTNRRAKRKRSAQRAAGERSECASKPDGGRRVSSDGRVCEMGSRPASRLGPEAHANTPRRRPRESGGS